MLSDADYVHDPRVPMDPHASTYSDDSDELDRPRIPVLTPTPPSSRTPPPEDQGHMMTHDRSHRPHHRDRTRHSANREFMQMLVGEELQAKQTRKFLRSALARLDDETRRAQEAERRALELAERFKLVNDARMATQAELTRVNEELRQYKVHYDNARQEILRGQEILKALEQQRDEAEASAARARTTARKLKEEQLAMRAREEGRKAGYAEGLRRGLEQARLQFERGRATTEDGESFPANEGSIPESRAGPLDEIPLRNLSSPAPSVTIQSPTPRRNIPAFDMPADAPPPGSRFREHGIGMTPAGGEARLPNGTPQWPDQPIRPTSVADMPSSPRRLSTNIPDGWIPRADENGHIDIPPSHALQGSPRSPTMPLPIPPPYPERNSQNTNQGLSSRDYAYTKPQTPSLAESVPTSMSTRMSDFDILNPPTNAPPASRDRKSGLSVIHEVSSSAEYSPGMSGAGMPEPIVFPGVPGNRGTDEPGSRSRTPRSRTSGQRPNDDMRYHDPRAVDEWRRDSGELRSNPSRSSLGSHHPAPSMPSPLGQHTSTPADYLRPNSVGGSRTPQPHRSPSVMSHRSNNSSKYPPSSSGPDITINIEPPSGPPSSSLSPVTQRNGLLSPNSTAQELPPSQPIEPPQPPQVFPQVPTVPNSPSGMGRYPSLGAIPDVLPGPPIPVDTLPPGFLPTPVTHNRPLESSPRAPPANIYDGYRPPSAVPEIPRSSSTTSSGPPGGYPKNMHSRSFSVGSASNDNLRSKTPVARPPSSASSGAGIYAAAPTPPGFRYPAAPGRPPTAGSVAAGNMSPRSTTSGHYRSLSLNAGSTPAPLSRPLSTGPPKLRRVGSDASNDSGVSGFSASAKQRFSHYNRDEALDPAYFVGSDVPTDNVTHANTQANARGSRR